MDYACLTEKGLFKQSELNEEEQKHAERVIVVYYGGSRGPFMHVVPSKATSMDKFASERVVEDIVYLILVSSFGATMSQHCCCSSRMH